MRFLMSVWRVLIVGSAVLMGMFISETGKASDELSSVILVSPTPIEAGQPATISLTVVNDGPSEVENLTPSLDVFMGECIVSSLSEPSPASFDLTHGSSTTFYWSLTVSETGALGLAACVSGDSSSSLLTTCKYYIQDGTEYCVLAPSAITVTLYPTDTPIRASQPTSLRLCVRNVGPSVISGIFPSLEFTEGESIVSSLIGPYPSYIQNLDPFYTECFYWQLTTNMDGALAISGCATGISSGGSVDACAYYYQGELPPNPEASSSLVVSPAPVGAEQPTFVSLQVTNSGDLDIYNIQPALVFTEGACMVKSLSGPYPALADLEAGSSTTFNWSFTLSVTGALRIDVSAVGIAEGGATVYVSESYTEDGVDRCVPEQPCDETNLTWTIKAPMNEPRSLFGAEAVAGKIYVFGGMQVVNEGERYDPVADSWTRIAPKPTAGWGMAATAIGSTIYVMGGGWATYYEDTGDKVEIYDTVGNTWGILPDLPAPRWCPAAATVNGVIYLLGGYFDGAKDTNWVLDAYSGNWSGRAPMPWARAEMAVAVVEGKIYVMGGLDGSFTPYATVAAYDPLADSWEIKAAMNSPRRGAAAAAIDGKIYVMGGVGSYDDSGEVYDPVTNVWKAVTPMPYRVEYGQVETIGNLLYVFGGGSASLMEGSVCSVLPELPPEPPPTPPPGPALEPDNTLYVYPHPLVCPGGHAVFDMEKPGTATLRIMSLRGQTVKEISAVLPAMEDAQVFIDCGEVRNGTYMLNALLSFSDGTQRLLEPYKFVVAVR